jgi:hypothetical protein
MAKKAQREQMNYFNSLEGLEILTIITRKENKILMADKNNFLC